MVEAGHNRAPLQSLAVLIHEGMERIRNSWPAEEHRKAVFALTRTMDTKFSLGSAVRRLNIAHVRALAIPLPPISRTKAYRRQGGPAAS